STRAVCGTACRPRSATWRGAARASAGQGRRRGARDCRRRLSEESLRQGMRETSQRYDAEHRHATAYLLARRKATGCNESVIVLTNTRVVVERACSASVSRAAKVLADILDPAAEQTIRFHDLVSLL